jgi:subtilisin family serine protease
VIARSANANFRANILKDSRVGGAAATTHFATRLNDGSNASDGKSPPAPGTPAPGSDSLSGLQWDMDQINAPQARAINGGSPSIIVCDIDTGLDYTHPDLAANVDDANSVNCVSGAPVPGKVAAMDDNGHGTHTAGTIAAVRNGIGIIGVAPSVKIAGIKAGNADGFFFPEAVVCAFMWAGSHPIKVTNNSYFADPWLTSRNDPSSGDLNAERRAIKYAISNGVVVVAA